MVGRGYNQLMEELGYNQPTEEEDDSSTKACPPLMFLSYVFKRGIIYCFKIMHAIFNLLACRLTHQPDPLVALYLIP